MYKSKKYMWVFNLKYTFLEIEFSLPSEKIDAGGVIGPH